MPKSRYFPGYMLLYLTVLQMLSLFAAQLFQTKTASCILLILTMLAITSVGGYAIHIGDIPPHLWWSEMLSPERWLLPVIVADEYSVETLSNTAGQQLCRNKQVCVMTLISRNNSNLFCVFLRPIRSNTKRLSCSIRARCQTAPKSCKSIGFCVRIIY